MENNQLPPEKIKMPLSKRAFDIMASIMILILFLPLIFLILLGYLIEAIFYPASRGRILYSEKRLSAGEMFMIYKFRIYKQAILAEAANNGSNTVHTKDLEKDGANLTYLGRLLRRVYFDELPQLINILKGEMSLVGPRPTNLENCAKLWQEGKFAKYLIKAGLTGYFQSHKGRKLNLTQEEIDMQYVEFCRTYPGWRIVLYDLKIILITILTVLRAEGL